MSIRASVTCLLPAAADLGECPVWSQDEGRLYWVDIDGRAIHRYDPSSGQDQARVLTTRPGSIALTSEPGYLLVASENLIGYFNWESSELTSWFELDSVLPGVRLNDGRCDAAGRFWTGSMYERPAANRFEGNLYRIEANGSHTVMRRQIGVANGLAFSPDGATMYFADTLRETVWSYEYDLDAGTIRNESVFNDFVDLPGRPDGACIDESGCYWVACVYGWAVARLTPEGTVDRIIEMPIEKPTMPAFGGSDLSTLFVTSIGGGSEDRVRDRPESGGLFALEPGVAGLPEPRFAGEPATVPGVSP